MITAEIVEGNLWSSALTITDDHQNVGDPGTLVLAYSVNGGDTITLTYTDATVPRAGLIARLSEGVYEAQVDLTSLSGSITRYWQSTGANQGVSEVDTIIIPDLPF
ncbi:MAG: hypothetical protein ACRD6W_01385 [Nitrososphaerales archaeon]